MRLHYAMLTAALTRSREITLDSWNRFQDVGSIRKGISGESCEFASHGHQDGGSLEAREVTAPCRMLANSCGQTSGRATPQ